jgi:hypothetical protein
MREDRVVSAIVPWADHPADQTTSRLLRSP